MTTGVQAADGALLEVHDAQANVGLAAAAVVDGELVYTRELGLADLEHGVPVSQETRFHVASVMKPFTAAAALRLAERGVFDLDAPVRAYLADFPHTGVTGRLLAAHLGGIRHTHDDERTAAFLTRHFDDVADSLALFEDDPLVAPPGEEYHYSSYGYGVLAAAMQAAAGRPFQRLVDDEVFASLGLGGTLFNDTRVPVAGRARGYTYFDPLTYAESSELLRAPDWDYSFNLGGGNLLSTATDIARFGWAFVDPGFLGADSLRLTRSAVTPSPWSVGWIVGRANGLGLRLRMTGSNPGFQAGLAVFPDTRVAVAVASNAWGRGAASGQLVTDVLDRVAAALSCR